MQKYNSELDKKAMRKQIREERKAAKQEEKAKRAAEKQRKKEMKKQQAEVTKYGPVDHSSIDFVITDEGEESEIVEEVIYENETARRDQIERDLI